MIDWLKRQALLRFITKDTEKVLATVSTYSSTHRIEIAQDVRQFIDGAIADLRAINGPDPDGEAQAYVQGLVLDAKRLRHEAVLRDGTGTIGPEWAAAALIETWVVALSGRLGQRASRNLGRLVTSHVAETLGFDPWAKA